MIDESKLILPDPNNVRIIISDCDGTLLNSKHELSERTNKAINYALDNYDVNFVIATGKTRYSVTHIRKQLNIDMRKNCLAVHSNGCVIYDDKDQVIKEFFMDKDIVLKNIELYNKHLAGRDYSYVLYVRDVLYLPRKDKWSAFLEEYGERVAIYPEPELLKMVENNELAINKVCVLTTPEVFYDGFDKILQKFIDSYEGISFITGNTRCYETQPEEISKGASLKYIMEELNVKPEQVMAFGDSFNDISMFNVAGYKYAMGNSEKAVMEVATNVTESNDEDGIAVILENTFMKNKKN
ncbi:HAD-like protein [Piromyces finnis]|uniref:HAD-like protein n=1 Tax=Piromyces finnis TaxID=1754191 RepID=A0A1Y1VMZ5_9FUNG|nr:HAD-like protein [Piromyces finnis]|eukprot:ORX59274.1 HAD-like protein [Piromyces finnis]